GRDGQPTLSGERPPGVMSGRSAARKRSDRVDSLLCGLSERLGGSVALVALGAYGRRELTPRGDAELLFLHDGQLTLAWVTEAVCYPLWEQAVRLEPSVRTLAECAADARRSSQALDFLLETLSAAEEIAGHTLRHLTKRLQDRVSHSPGKPVLEDLYGHARWVAFSLDNALAPERDDRQLGPVLALRSGQLVAERMPPVERAPA